MKIKAITKLEPFTVMCGVLSSRTGYILERLDFNYVYVSVKTRFGNYVKTVLTTDQLIFKVIEKPTVFR
ncbi:hypothetical protein SAMN04488136_11632 [Vibrio xiamenensis]|uniref:Uncharacterized protein n=1 Tax=Vibrio xiamenensis TaxID=861298 RepID=A0A1G8CFN6_9VIBR|nr:hypothetical protein [Vibrio xiamenensis]SDH44023.1 hypothetical protein SAMN04488136_11632 [Vibrio xiamenensis]